MKILRILLFCFLSADTTEFVTASIWVVPEGGNLSLHSYLTVSGSTKFLCKDKCERAEDILIKTNDTTAQSGRYSIKYMNASSGRGKVTFTITHMTKLDAGMYRFGLGKSLVPDSYSEFEARVSDERDKNSGIVRAQNVGGKIRFPCANTVPGKRKFLCRDPCKTEGDILIDTTNDTAQSGRYMIEYIKGSAFGLYATINNLTKSDTGKYRCGYGNPLSPDSYDTEDIFVIYASRPPVSTPQTTAQSPSFTTGISTMSSDFPDSASRSWDGDVYSSVATPQATTQSPSFTTGMSTMSSGYAEHWNRSSDEASNPPVTTRQTTPQSPSFTSGISMSSACPDSLLLLVFCVSLISVLLLSVFLLLLYICKTRKKARFDIRENVHYANMKDGRVLLQETNISEYFISLNESTFSPAT